MGEARERLKERHDARVAEAQGGRALVGFDGRALQPIKRLLRQYALMTDALNFQKLAIDLVAEVAQMGHVVDGFPRLTDEAITEIHKLRKELSPEDRILFESALFSAVNNSDVPPEAEPKE